MHSDTQYNTNILLMYQLCVLRPFVRPYGIIIEIAVKKLSLYLRNKRNHMKLHEMKA